MIRQTLLATLLLTACSDETITAYAPKTTWHLTTLNAKPITTPITLTLAKTQISGQAPCNAYSAFQSAPAPWFQTGPIRATKRACKDLALEHQYFQTLKSARLAEASPRVLILSDENNRPLLTFRATP